MRKLSSLCFLREYLTIIPPARMGSESIAMRPMAEWAIESEAMRAKGIIVLVTSNYLVKNIETKQLKLAKSDSAAIVLVFKAGTFRY